MQKDDFLLFFEAQLERGNVPIASQIAALSKFDLLIPISIVENTITEAPYVGILEAWAQKGWEVGPGICVSPDKKVLIVSGEAYDVESMYSMLFQGLIAISDLQMANVFQDNCRVSYEDMEGFISISFTFEDKTYSLEVDFEGDAYHFRIVKEINQILIASLTYRGKQFYSIDTIQGKIYFYCTKDWAIRFQKETLCYLNNGD